MTSTASRIRRLLLASVLVGTGAVVGFSGSASAANVASQSFQISPPTATYTGDPGTGVKGIIKVTNLTDLPLSLNVGKQNFVARGEEGEIELVDNANPLYSLAPWFLLSANRLEVPPKATRELPYSISIPPNAEPGGRYGSIIFSTIPPKLPSGQSGAAVQQTIASIAFLRINGPAREELKMESFAAKKSFYEYGPVELLARVKNTGTVHEKPTGTITIKNMLGMKVASFPLDEHYVIPDSIRRLENSWPTGKNKPFLFGRYTAELTAKYGAPSKTLTATTSFTVLPWKLVAIVLAILIFVFFIFIRGRKRFKRAFRILAGKE
jgi:hypothetical protein